LYIYVCLFSGDFQYLVYVKANTSDDNAAAVTFVNTTVSTSPAAYYIQLYTFIWIV